MARKWATYDNVQLEHHVELQENAKTPQYQQALAVANLNKQRNEGPVDSMRTEWWNFQDYVDAKHELKEHPDNVKSKQKLVSSEHLILGMDVRNRQGQRRRQAARRSDIPNQQAGGAQVFAGKNEGRRTRARPPRRQITGVAKSLVPRKTEHSLIGSCQHTTDYDEKSPRRTPWAFVFCQFDRVDG